MRNAEPFIRATLDSVLVTATVSNVLSLSDQCSSAYGVDVLLNNYASDTCVYEFGSTTDASTTMRIDSSAGAFLSGAFADHVGGCGPLINDTVRIKYTAGSAGVSSSLGCTVSGAGTVTIDETDGVTLTNVTTANGAITLTTGGLTTVENVNSGASNLNLAVTGGTPLST